MGTDLVFGCEWGIYIFGGFTGLVGGCLVVGFWWNFACFGVESFLVSIKIGGCLILRRRLVYLV